MSESLVAETAVASSPVRRAPAAPRGPREACRRAWAALLERRHGALAIVVVLSVAVAALTRGALLWQSRGQVAWDASLLGAFACGVVFDVAAILWWTLPLGLLLAALPRRFFAGRSARALAWAGFAVAGYALLFAAVAEWLFWDEFGVRFNFIAVDYLVYTTEVMGNIRESYPMPWIFGGLAAASAGLGALLWRTGWVGRWLAAAEEPAGRRWLGAAGWTAATLALGLGLSERTIPTFANNYNRELAKSGAWSLFAAFRANQLDFDGFYATMPVDAAFRRTQQLLASDGSERLTHDPNDLLRLVKHAGPELRPNVIQITVESLSADFLGRYGNRDGLTPNLDALAPRALVFDRFYATGTRTDRGMEALTLSVPPTPGRSLVKRPENDGLFTLGSVFRSKGYSTSFLYGGFGYFDNMNAFFGGNGYRVLDRTKVEKSDITFANVWGACDEDLFRWTLREADQDYAAGRPFFHFVMTTSNHRPFTYPLRRIDLPPQSSGRSGGVKYTDYAIGEFLKAAESKPWFKNTIFVIVADHCASSAGKTELPVQNYHIPCLVYAPGGQVKPGAVKVLTSQIDYAPTLLGLLRWSYPSRFYGRDVLAADAADGRAFIGNYQKLGLYRGGELAVLQPMRKTGAFDYNEDAKELRKRASDQRLVDDAIAYYQTASWLFKHHAQREYAAPAAAP